MHHCVLFASPSPPSHVDSHHSYRYPPASVPIAYVSLQPCGSSCYKWFSNFIVFPQFDYKSLPLLNIALRTLDFYPTHSMWSPTLGCLLETQFLAFQLRCPLATVCVLLLDLAVTIAKSYLVLVFSIEDTSI